MPVENSPTPAPFTSRAPRQLAPPPSHAEGERKALTLDGEVRELLRGTEVNDLEELKRQGLSMRAISELTGFDRKTIRKYLDPAEWQPIYGPRQSKPGDCAGIHGCSLRLPDPSGTYRPRFK